jgi:hypothetical protein
MISALSMPCRQIEVTPRLVWPELALDDDQWHALAGHLDGVRVTELVWREAPPDAGPRCDVSQLGAHGGV